MDTGSELKCRVGKSEAKSAGTVMTEAVPDAIDVALQHDGRVRHDAHREFSTDLLHVD
jgi:hypothetical protein